ncbi:hypothetical protein IC582_022381 [Cucumis melo]|uniref:BTB/POZ domain-containing protein n=2 Tax=Cucumis melo TaxID=3656 RepID=A0A5A7TLX2_CUCMM|nr:BTB/POZ domain-containing protein At5g41330 [Cucumis melo]KAA0042747.1 BTB/POZ domain-containing protein [Cucumis melo var. makuwa]
MMSPPISGSISSSPILPQPLNPESNIVTINVGGHLFQTTKQTLALAGSRSLLSTISDSSQSVVPFIDRDPDLFSVIISLLRTGYLPSKAKAFDLQDLISESQFYGVESLLINSLSNPSQFEAFNLEKSLILPLNGRDSPSTIATTPFGSLHVAHGGKITSFDWSLQRKTTILTQFSVIDSLLALSPSLAAAGATDFSGLQILNLQTGQVKSILNWENVTRSSSTVQAIGASSELLFTSFESGRRNSNSIMIYDLQTFNPVNEIARNEIYGAEIDSAIPATMLKWVAGYNLLMASGSHSGPSGVQGNIKFWDIRSGNIAWEVKEKVDCFSDMTLCENLSAIFKIGVSSGEVYSADLRKLGDGNPWVCLGDRTKVMNGKKVGVGGKIESYGNQVFCSREGGSIELWSEVTVGNGGNKEGGLGLEERVFRKNLMGRMKDLGGGKVMKLGFGGNKMFVIRKDEQCVEVWKSSGKGFWDAL